MKKKHIIWLLLFAQLNTSCGAPVKRPDYDEPTKKETIEDIVSTNPSAALGKLRQYELLHPENKKFLAFMYGSIADKIAGDYPHEAIGLYENVLVIEPENVRVLIHLSKTYNSVGETANARDINWKLYDITLNKPEILSNPINNAETGSNEEYTTFWYEEIWGNLADSFRESGYPDEAIGLLQQIVQMNPIPLNYLFLAQAQYNNGNYIPALDSINESLSKTEKTVNTEDSAGMQGYIPMLQLRAEIYTAMGRYKETVQDYEELIIRNPDEKKHYERSINSLNKLTKPQ